MSAQHDFQADFDRRMRAWFESDARGREPEHLLGNVMQRASRTRRLPGWLLPERWLPMQLTMRAPAIPRPAPVILVLAALILAALLAAVLVGAPRKLPEPFGPAANGLIAYDTSAQIFVANPDGTGKRVLVPNVPYAAAATFSPDGTQIAFWGDNSPDSLFVVNADGSDLRKIAGDLWISTNRPPAWSPDGRTLAFSSESGPDRNDQRIYVVEATTGAVPRIVAGGGTDDIQAFEPSWSPDNDWIAFVGVGRPGSRLWLVHPSGADAHPVSTIARVGIAQPQWAPSTDRLQVAFGAALTLDGQQDVFVYDVASGTEQSPAPDVADERYPAWSPDGRRLAWLTGQPSGLRILTDGSPVVLPLPVGAMDGPPSWSPDGTRIFALNDARTVITVLSVDRSAPIVSIPHVASQGEPTQQRLAP
jgi:Tol biopolymer transport system component